MHVCLLSIAYVSFGDALFKKLCEIVCELYERSRDVNINDLVYRPVSYYTAERRREDNGGISSE